MTLKEYLEDYASTETQKIGLELIQKELSNIPNPDVRKIVEERLSAIHSGKRDFRF